MSQRKYKYNPTFHVFNFTRCTFRIMQNTWNRFTVVVYIYNKLHGSLISNLNLRCQRTRHKHFQLVADTSREF